MSLKADLRARALAVRAGQGGDGQALTARLLAALAPFAGRALAGYWPMRDEADPRPAMAAHEGPLCLPVVTGKGVPLIFRQWNGGALEPGPFGTSHPGESVPGIVPQVLVVPLAAFDRAGNRIGYGGGYYDRTLQLLRENGAVTAIGLAFSCQEVPEISAESYDQPLDMVVTDCEIIDLRRSGAKT
ncbi:5-formyltetrahydrofolate cyclo-ligase [Paracoccus sp. (in: a-proteobacteria)]|uniref:5-formyltetrahydrofolate cyclo-ligase n=1 Tax=Paracoccus sp. TaxID=267 RepID=UPI003A880614